MTTGWMVKCPITARLLDSNIVKPKPSKSLFSDRVDLLKKLRKTTLLTISNHPLPNNPRTRK